MTREFQKAFISAFSIVAVVTTDLGICNDLPAMQDTIPAIYDKSIEKFAAILSKKKYEFSADLVASLQVGGWKRNVDGSVSKESLTLSKIEKLRGVRGEFVCLQATWRLSTGKGHKQYYAWIRKHGESYDFVDDRLVLNL